MSVLQKGISYIKERLWRDPGCGVGWDADNHIAQTSQLYDGLSSKFYYYQWIIDELASSASRVVVPLSHLFQVDVAGKKAIGLRHDIDMDPFTAVRCARYLGSQGLSGSFYLLHTNPYYGNFHGKVFVRNPHVIRWAQDMVLAGSEVGLHQDALHLYKNHGISGSSAVLFEISWLRSNGIAIQGTVAHNSGPLYGAENFEIFRGHVLWSRNVLGHGGRPIPLGRLNGKSLGLHYEGTFARPRKKLDRARAEAFFADKGSCRVASESWMKTFLWDNPTCEFLTDGQFWLLGPDRWVASGNVAGLDFFEWNVNFKRVLEILDDMPNGTRSVFVVHPEYVRD